MHTTPLLREAASFSANEPWDVGAACAAGHLGREPAWVDLGSRGTTQKACKDLGGERCEYLDLGREGVARDLAEDGFGLKTRGAGSFSNP